MSSQGHSVSYLVGESKISGWQNGRVYSLSKNLRLSWAGNRLSISLIPRYKKIKQVIQARKFDVIHVQVPYSPFMSQLVINRASTRTAVVGTVHVFPSGWLSEIGSKLLRLIYGRSLKRFDEILSVSSAAQTYAKESFNQSTRVIPNAVDLSALMGVAEHNGSEVKKIVFLGRLVDRKGCEYLLRAFKLTFENLPQTKLVIAGDGPERKKLERLSESLGINENTVFLGRVSEEEKARLFASADIACFPSLYGESFGIVLIEAMAAGAKIVLGGDNPGYSSVLGERKELLVNPKDTKLFTARLQKLLTDDELATELQRWQKAQLHKYDISTVGRQIEAVYYRAIASRAKRRHN